MATLTLHSRQSGAEGSGCHLCLFMTSFRTLIYHFFFRFCFPEQAECVGEADRSQGERTGEGGVDVPHHSRPEDSSGLRSPAGPHHHLQHRGLHQPNHPVLRTWVPYFYTSLLKQKAESVLV